MFVGTSKDVTKTCTALKGTGAVLIRWIGALHMRISLVHSYDLSTYTVKVGHIRRFIPASRVTYEVSPSWQGYGKQAVGAHLKHTSPDLQHEL